MYVIIKVTKEDEKNNIEPLFVASDGSRNHVSLSTIMEVMNNLLTEEQKEVISFVKLYASSDDFEDCPPCGWSNEIKDIYFLLKIVDGYPKEILEVASNAYDLDNAERLLNKEVKDENIKYQVFNVRGKLK